ncbi:ATP-binding cassette domain-containing protein [Macrococcoides caseolyticum]|uniref:ABC transporter ATP-binding protein n=1 Tax=Macrococcoides caseolyticum TaxID=69966 RepID=UPI00105B49B2|nr:ATP-binding cassette domain-containing protein [Macrococcus caseolyticus]TDM28777.1 ATP-binding cassette domain-containing protein [Macrococcus caseolyticus]VUC64613.1 ABC transporter ATP-binding protein [Macrococcus caseolyticus]
MILKLENITKIFGEDTAVNSLDFEVSEGKMLGFLGQNGAGKTTTFRMILGLIDPTEGNIIFNDDLKSNLYNHIGYLPEERGLHTKLKVYDELLYMGQLKGLDKKDLKFLIDYWLKEFQIEQYKYKKIESLSKGNQQKIQLLTSILHDPQLLILDEPFSGLDPVNVELLKKAILSLKNKGRTIILSTHRMEHVEELCDSVIIMKNGAVIASGSVSDIKDEYEEKKIVIEGKGDIELLKSFKGIKKIKHDKNGYIIHVTSGEVVVPLFNLIKDHFIVKNFQVLEPTLNEIFIDKVGGKYE